MNQQAPIFGLKNVEARVRDFLGIKVPLTEIGINFNGQTLRIKSYTVIIIKIAREDREEHQSQLDLEATEAQFCRCH